MTNPGATIQRASGSNGGGNPPVLFRLAALEQRFGKLEDKVGQVEGRVGDLAVVMARIETRMDSLASRQFVTWHLVATVASVLFSIAMHIAIRNL